MPEHPRVTLQQVATRAGVSVPTVSKVLNGHRGVADETHGAVQSAIAELGYVSPRQKRSAADRSALVEVVIRRVDSDYHGEILSGVLDAAAEAGVEIVISSVASPNAVGVNGRTWAARLRASGRRGVIVVVGQLTQPQTEAFRVHGIPAVVIDPMFATSHDVATIASSNWAGARAAVEHLLARGRRRIAFVGGPAGAAYVEDRAHGYRAALQDARLAVVPELVSFGPFGRDEGRRVGASLLALPAPPDAVFAANDELAIGVLDAARARGITVPGALAVVGFDGTRAGADAWPALTSVAQPLYEMGRAALRAIVSPDDRAAATPRLELACTLEVRASS